MIDHNTPARIAELGDTITRASEELDRIIRELSAAADDKMAEAARAFLEAHQDRQPVLKAYRDAHRTMLTAAVAASNIHEMAERANTLRSRCAYWGNGPSRQEARDLGFVCGVAPAVETQS